MKFLKDQLPNELIHHDGSEFYISNPYPEFNEEVVISLRTAKEINLINIYLRSFPNGEASLDKMIPCWEKNYTIWKLKIKINEPITHYRFLLQTTEDLWWFSAAGLSLHEPLDQTDFKLLANYHAPNWLKTAIFYQIFPDTFANANPENDPKPEEYTYKGFQPRTFAWEQSPEKKQPDPLVFYGGDLDGITNNLDYLEQLGVNALYLNPIFTAPSNHKYDVADYDEVDPHFGGNEALISLRNGLSERGMHYILDIVPNHCGSNHHWFKKAQMDSTSKEAGFFTFHKHPESYESWLGVKTLPKLNYANQVLCQNMFQSENAIFKKWLQPPYSADGWRIDVANMLGRQDQIQINMHIARQIRQAVKNTNSDSYLIGENFFDASDQLQGDQWDAVMNYQGFTTPIWHWLTGVKISSFALQEEISASKKWPTEAFANAIQIHLAAIPWVIALQQFNVLDSHDTDRIRTIVNDDESLHRIAAVLQMTFPGVPCIYYGDELGLQNDPDRYSRACMPWNSISQETNDFIEFYRKLIHLRKNLSPLISGGFQFLFIEEDTFAYQRENDSGIALIIAHRGNNSINNIEVPVYVDEISYFTNLFTNEMIHTENGILKIPSQTKGASLWYYKKQTSR
jgi:alpha-glucosidase